MITSSYLILLRICQRLPSWYFVLINVISFSPTSNYLVRILTKYLLSRHDELVFPTHRRVYLQATVLERFRFADVPRRPWRFVVPVGTFPNLGNNLLFRGGALSAAYVWDINAFPEEAALPTTPPRFETVAERLSAARFGAPKTFIFARHRSD